MIAEAVLDTEARDAYEAIAPAYDVLTGGYAHERWLESLERLAHEHGLTGHRLLDVACGTGASFMPMIKRGYAVTACDISVGMLERARLKAPGADLHLADMRRLPTLGSFDLITCVDDALNYILTEQELELTIRGLAKNLAAGGLALWDVNTLAQYRGQFATDRVIAHDDLFIGWSGHQDSSALEPGDLVDIGIDVFAREPRGHWQRRSSVHRQRHWPRPLIEEICDRAGLELLDVRGQHPGAVIDGYLDELVHIKAIYVARRSERSPT